MNASWFLNNTAWTSGLLLGTTFIAAAVWQNVRLNDRRSVTSISVSGARVVVERHVRAQRFVEAHCVEQRASIEAWLRVDDVVGLPTSCCVVVGATPSVRSELVSRCLATSWRGAVIKVDLLALPTESVADWIPRLAESSRTRANWNVFATAFEQLYSLLRGSDLQTDRLLAASDARRAEESAAQLSRLREALKLVEVDVGNLRQQHGPVVLVMDGLERFLSPLFLALFVDLFVDL